MEQNATITSVERLTHDVLRIRAQKPEGLAYEPGQAADISIAKPGWEKEIRAFTFTSLPSDPYIEFVIKTYPAHNGVTNQLRALVAGDALLLHGVFGEIRYKGDGLFIAGGAGITPFIAIFRQLEQQGKLGGNTLLFANKTQADIILEERFRALLGDRFINVLSGEERQGYAHGYITAELIQQHRPAAGGHYYLCGPDPMMDAVEKHLAALGVPKEAVVREGF